MRLTSKYVYKGMDITLDVYEKLRAVVEILAKHEARPFDDCLVDFTSSQTYKALSVPDSLMWSESAPFIVDEYYRELGRPTLPCD